MRDAGTEPKVDKLDYSISLVKENILQLDISVSDVPLMTVVDTLHHLTPQELSLKLGHLSIRLLL